MRNTAILSLLCVGACASTGPDTPGLAHYSLGSGYSSGSSEPQQTTGVGMSGGADTGLIARPDVLILDARIEKEDASASQAFAQTQAAVTDLTARLKQATSNTAVFTPCGTHVTPIGGRPTESFRVVIEGRVEVALAPELDYWKRSALLVALAELADRYDAARAAKTADKGVSADRGVSLRNTHVAVRNPESYRGKLTELWVQRARAFAAAAQTHEAPLVLLDCAPPGEIIQRQKSLEEVALSLAVGCRLGSLRAPAATAPPAAR